MLLQKWLRGSIAIDKYSNQNDVFTAHFLFMDCNISLKQPSLPRAVLHKYQPSVFSVWTSLYLTCTGKTKPISSQYHPYVGDTVASWLVHLTPEQVVRVQTLAGDIMLCSWQDTLLSWCLSWILVSLMLGVTLRWIASHPGGSRNTAYSWLPHATETGIALA